MKLTIQALRDHNVADVIRRHHPLFHQVEAIADTLHANDVARQRLSALRPDKAGRYLEMALEEEGKLARELARLNVIV